MPKFFQASSQKGQAIPHMKISLVSEPIMSMSSSVAESCGKMILHATFISEGCMRMVLNVWER